MYLPRRACADKFMQGSMETACAGLAVLAAKCMQGSMETACAGLAVLAAKCMQGSMETACAGLAVLAATLFIKAGDERWRTLGNAL